jgi:hypothetical protein
MVHRADVIADVSCPGVLPELNALGALLEGSVAWARDGAGVRGRMLAILADVAERYASTGARKRRPKRNLKPPSCHSLLSRHAVAL